jgi:aspartyl-tRNA(Asn)/glutamyl-tRNA(Gln) amidotransferase subunit B
MANYVPSIGMEVHAELLTQSKMFSRCPVAFGGEPNTRVDPVTIGLPGALPVPNRYAIELVLKTALALNCTIPDRSVFHRKNYFYPDLPKGYQISQYGETNPLGYKGWLEIPTEDGGYKKIKIRRVHLEEDTGKLMHLPGGGSGVDYNRAGVPLMEIVTDFPPDIENADEARAYVQQLRQVLLYLGVCDGKMEEGSLRCEPNISVRPEGSSEYGTKTELKNLNSFRSVLEGAKFEIRRQIAVYEQGGEVYQETRGWNEASMSTFVMRVKEGEDDYRYFPDPDLIPMMFDPAYLDKLRAELPELPLQKERRYREKLGLSTYDAQLLVSDPQSAAFFEEAVSQGGDPKRVCNWMNSDFAKLLNETGQVARVQGNDPDGREVSKVSPAHLVELTKLIGEGTISGKIGKEIFGEIFSTGEMPGKLVEKKGLTQISDSSAIVGSVREVIEANPDPVESYKNGKQNVIGFLVGQVMKKTQGRANPKMVQEELRKQLGE